MVTAKQIRALLEAKPFKPFRIYMSDGSHCDITNHDAAFVMKNTVEVGLNVNPDGFAEYAGRLRTVLLGGSVPTALPYFT